MIIFRYLLREIVLTSTAVSAGLLVIFISARFVKYLAKAAAGEMSGEILFAATLLRMPQFIELILPLGFFLGILLTYGRLYVESEMIVMQACGISRRRLLAYTQIPALVVATIVGSFSLYLSPISLQNFHRIWDNPENFSGLSTLRAGRFQSLAQNRGVTYAETIGADKQQLQQVFLAGTDKMGGQERLAIVVAEQGTVRIDRSRDERFIELNDGYRYEGRPGNLDFRITRFERYGQRIADHKVELPPPVADEKPTLDLLDSPDSKDAAALQWRISMPLMVPVIALIALSLSETSHRRGRFIKLLPGVLLFIFYVMALTISRGAVEKQQLPPALGLWWCHVLFLIIGYVIYAWDDLRLVFQRRGRS